MSKGHDMESASAICTQSLQDAGEDIFEAAAAREFLLRTAGIAPRLEMLQGKEHLVVPVVALMEGVIHAVNADVPEYVTPEFLAQTLESWNGRPCVLGHPTQGNVQVSANDPRIASEREFGRVYKAQLRPGSRLAMEAWIDPARLEALGEQQMLADLRAGKPIEVSVGANVRTTPADGNFHGKAYKAKWLSGSGDHLAFLPRGRGACSVDMGCGACRAAEARPEYEIDDKGWRELGGPGSGWSAEGGHVPGSQGGDKSNSSKAQTASTAAFHASDKANFTTHKSDQERIDSQQNAAAANHKAADAHEQAAATARTDAMKNFHETQANIHRTQADSHANAARLYAGIQSAKGQYHVVSNGLTVSQHQTLKDAKAAAQSHVASGKGTMSSTTVHDTASGWTHGQVPLSGSKSSTWVSIPGDKSRGASMNGEKGGLLDRLRAFATSVRVLSNPEGINQYSKGGGSSGGKAEHFHGSGGHFSSKLDRSTGGGIGRYKVTDHSTGDTVFAHNTKEGADKAAQQMANGQKVTVQGGTFHSGRTAQAYDTPEQAASEEAAELVGYNTLRTHLDAMNSALGDATGIVNDLISDEEDDPTETPAQEEAEEEVEGARLDALMSLLGSIGASSQQAYNVCLNLNAPDLPAPSDPRYMEAKAAAGKEISAKNMQTIQAAHDAAHDMHDHTTNLGAQCNGMKLLETSVNQGETDMDKKVLIKNLTECDCSGFTAADVKTLEAMSEEQLQRFETRRLATKKAEDDLKAAQAKTTEAEAALKAASEKKQTEAEVLAQFPSLKALVDRAAAAEAARKAELVGKLKTAQQAYSEDELKALELPALEKLATIAKVDQPKADYSGRGLAGKTDEQTENYAPPKPYDLAFKAMQEGKRVN